MIYFRCYIEDYDGATLDLSMSEDGAYGRLMRHYYRTEQPLPADAQRVARVCRAVTPEERAAVESVLERYFVRQADGWHNKRADREIAVAKIARDNGALGGRPKTGIETDDETTSQTARSTASRTEQQTEDETRNGGTEGGKSGQPISLLTSQPSNLPPSQPKPLPTRTARGPKKTDPESISGPSWDAYSAAYQRRYRVPPPRNAKVNATLVKLVELLGKDEAPQVAAFYVTSNERFYVLKKHPTDLLVKDAAKLRTEWMNGESGTETQAAQADRQQATGNAFAKMLVEAEEAEPSSGSVIEPEGLKGPDEDPLAMGDGEGEGIAWWRSDDLVLARAVEEGVRVIPEQPWPEFVARVYAASGPGPWLDEADAETRELAEAWKRRGVNPPLSDAAGRRQPFQSGGR